MAMRGWVGSAAAGLVVVASLGPTVARAADPSDAERLERERVRVAQHLEAASPVGRDACECECHCNCDHPSGDPGRWYRDPAGGLLAGASVITLGFGIGMWAHSARLRDQESLTSEQHAQRVRQTAAHQRAGIGLTLTGVVVGIAAVVRYAVVAGRNRYGERRLTWTGTGLRARF